jgi:hypothetical protein
MKRGLILCMLGLVLSAGTARAGDVRIATFDVDASPAVGSPLAYDPTKEITERLSCRGVVLLSDQPAIVMCTVDWLGVANEANDRFREALAEAAGTSYDRVVMHALHQHDAPRCDLGAALLLAEAGHRGLGYDVPFIEGVIARAAAAVKAALPEAQPVDAFAFGAAEVSQVASNRRMLDAQGRVAVTRFTACRDEAIRGLPEGVIDPKLRVLTFFHQSRPVARLSFFATHPQSYYRTGGANPDFPGMARNQHQQETGVFQVHFNGAGGNIGAGKYNDGSREMRQVLATRVLSGMQAAVADSRRQPLTSADLAWNFDKVALPLADHLREEELLELIHAPTTDAALRIHSADKLAYLRQVQAGKQIQISCLTIGDARVLFMPGELFVEYQLAAAELRPDLSVAMAAYGDYGPFYIGTRVAFPQGGYETSPRATNVAPEVEEVLMGALRKLLAPVSAQVAASDFTDRTGPGVPQ